MEVFIIADLMGDFGHAPYEPQYEMFAYFACDVLLLLIIFNSFLDFVPLLLGRPRRQIEERLYIHIIHSLEVEYIIEHPQLLHPQVHHRLHHHHMIIPRQHPHKPLKQSLLATLLKQRLQKRIHRFRLELCPKLVHLDALQLILDP